MEVYVSKSTSVNRKIINIVQLNAAFIYNKVLFYEEWNLVNKTGKVNNITPVSYTHLDVYKRQG